MPVTMQQVRAALDPDEPDYRRAAGLGPDALPYLERLVRGKDVLLASKATYLASLIDDPRSPAVIEAAAKSRDPALRVAAAAGARNLPARSGSVILLTLLDDSDVGVRKVALRSTPTAASPELRSRLLALSKSEAEPALRELSHKVLQRLAS